MDKKIYDEKVLEIENLIADGKGEEALNKANELEKEVLDAENSKQANEILNRIGEMQKINYGIVNEQKDKEGVQLMEKENKITYDEVFAKYIQGKDLSQEEQSVFNEYNVQNSAVTKTGNSAVIPETTMNKIFEELGETHAVLKDVEIMNVKGNLTLPVANFTDNTAFYDEATDTTDSSVATAEINLFGYDLKANITLSFNLKEMATPAFMDYVINKIVEKMGDKLANAVINGLGVPSGNQTHKAQPLGVVTALEAETNTPRVSTYASNATSQAKEKLLRDMIGSIKSGYNKKFYAKAEFIWDFIAGIQDSTGRPIFVPDPTGEFTGRIYGVPVVEEDAIPANCLLLGDFKKGYVVNFNKDIVVLTQDQNRYAKTDYTGYAIVDGKPTFSEAFAYLKKS